MLRLQGTERAPKERRFATADLTKWRFRTAPLFWLALAACLMALATPRASADITLVSRYSDAQASAQYGSIVDSPPPRVQTDFLPANLSSSATAVGFEGATADTTSSSSIAVDNAMGTLRVSGDGNAQLWASGIGALAMGSAKVIVLTFDVTDPQLYAMTGQLFAGGCCAASASAMLTNSSMTIFSVTENDPQPLAESGTLPPGHYTLSVEVSAEATESFLPPPSDVATASFDFALDPAPTPTPTPVPPAQALNLSTRLLVQTGDGAGIGGFIITGTEPKKVLLRGIGPSLSETGVNALADPILELHGPPGFQTVINDNELDWCFGGHPQIPPCFPPDSIGPPHDNPRESFIGLWLQPGAYTAILRGHENAPTGVGLFELYDLNQPANSRLANISTRAFVGTGNDMLIAGFILSGGSGNDTVVVRGIGPSLGLANALADPILQLRDSNGAIVAGNNDWRDSPSQAMELMALGLAPTNNLESGIVKTLSPGGYTALLSGNPGTGIGLLEVYDNPSRAP